MTEIPEHLLRRSRERRAALGGEEGEATAEATAATAEPTASAAPVPAAAAPPATEAGGGGAGAGRGRTATPAAEPEPAARIPARTRIPLWIMPVLAALPLWGIVYLGAFGKHKAGANDPVQLGGAIYASAGCAGCHGSNGEGGVGPKLSGGEVLQVWPNVADHRKWVDTGGGPYVGGSIGVNLKIPVPASNVMPAFGSDKGGSLSADQIAQVVCYERVTFGGETESTTNCPGFTGS